MCDVPRFLYAQGKHGWIWRLMIHHPTGCDVLARSARYYPDEAACRASSHHLTELRPDRIHALQSDDGTWGWRGYDPGGEVAFVSPTTFPTARHCQLEIVRLRAVVENGMIDRLYRGHQ